MARLTPAQLQAARVRSGNLGGRPRKPTVDEARAEALERLVPKAVRVLEEHLDSGRPDAWRSACRILDHSWGRPPEHVVPDPQRDGNEIDLDEVSTAQLAAPPSRASSPAPARVDRDRGLRVNQPRK